MPCLEVVRNDQAKAEMQAVYSHFSSENQKPLKEGVSG
jgi:hypothetical protein